MTEALERKTRAAAIVHMFRISTEESYTQMKHIFDVELVRAGETHVPFSMSAYSRKLFSTEHWSTLMNSFDIGHWC